MSYAPEVIADSSGKWADIGPIQLEVTIDRRYDTDATRNRILEIVAEHSDACRSAIRAKPVAFSGDFWLPTEAIEFYDPPEPGAGDDGWSDAELEASIAKDGIQNSLSVGKSKHDMALHNHRVFAFNGNHRLGFARKLGLPYVPCCNSDADDAVPLSREEIEALGGRFDTLPRNLNF